MQHKLITFIGGGNMAQAIIFGLLKQGYPANQICVCDPNEEKLAQFARHGIQTSLDNLYAVQQAESVLFAVKPQVLAEVCVPLSAVDFSDKLVISIAAGISVSRLTALLPTAKHIVRVMPNTPALVSEGMAGLFAAENVPELDKQFVEDLLNAVGKSCWIAHEQDMHTVTAASGSSPAYFFLFMESMQNTLIEMGLSKDMARNLVQQSALGAAKMVIENPQTELSVLRENVTSKGGTTAAALAIFEQQSLSDTIKQAMDACVARSKEMEKLF